MLLLDMLLNWIVGAFLCLILMQRYDFARCFCLQTIFQKSTFPINVLNTTFACPSPSIRQPHNYYKDKYKIFEKGNTRSSYMC